MLNYRKHDLWSAFVDFLFDNDEKVQLQWNHREGRMWLIVKLSSLLATGMVKQYIKTSEFGRNAVGLTFRRNWCCFEYFVSKNDLLKVQITFLFDIKFCGWQKEPAILISTLLLQTHAPQLFSLVLTRFCWNLEPSTTNAWNAKNAIFSGTL